MTSESERIELEDVSVRLISGRQVWESVTDLIGERTEVSVAIAYISRRGGELLPLRKGSSVVTDASIRSIRAGSTDPKVLQAWTRSGVRVYSLPRLHAKMIVAEGEIPFVVLGSANASGASADRLEEAVVVSDLADLVEDARQQIIRWKRQAGSPLTAAWLLEMADQFGADGTPADDPNPDDDDDDDEPDDDFEWPRPTSLDLVRTVADDSASAEAEAKLEDLLSEFADTDDYDNVLAGERIVWMFWTDQSDDHEVDERIFAEGNHVVTIELGASGRLSKNAPVYEPGRVLHSFVDSAHRPARRYYFVLAVASERPDVTYQNLVDALASIGEKPDWRGRYLRSSRVNAILDLWPDIPYTS